jgi:PPOX class probable F420-dependent enzyme
MGSSRSVAELPEWARGLLLEERVGRLGLIDDRGDPRVLPITYALAGSALVTAIDVSKPKRVSGERVARVRWLRARPRAALTVDRYDDDWTKLAWVQALGSMRVLDVDDAARAVAALAERYGQYRDRSPAGPVLVLEPERLLWWRAADAG